MAWSGIKRRIFISHYRGDRTEVDWFITKFSTNNLIFTPYVLGANDNDDFINSTNPTYVMQRIRQLYLKDSTVTVVLVGRCTHSRRYVDWEIKSSLQQGDELPNGLLAILLPSMGTSGHLPPRFEANWESSERSCYARYRACPDLGATLGEYIDDAYLARTSRAGMISNTQEIMKYNTECKVHGETH